MKDRDAVLTLQAESGKSRRKSDKVPASIYDFTLEELSAWIEERGHPAFRAKQLYQWIYGQLAESYHEISVLPLALREELLAELPFSPMAPVQEIWTDDGETLKLLYQTLDDQTFETVLMFYPDRATVCVSCQVGCAVGCSFCATGMGGLQRNLTTGEMVAQTIDMARRARDTGRDLTNLVMMGMGEPFHNYAATMKFVGIINDERGLNFGARRITISTSGIVPFIDKLADEPYQVNLAVSIHAGNDELRSSLVPINKRWPIAELLASVKRYTALTGRRVSFEYALMTGVNSSDDHARELALRLRGFNCHVNVIPYNPTPGSAYQRPTKAGVERFVEVLTEARIPATVRYSRGVEIAAACGQLRVQHESA